MEACCTCARLLSAVPIYSEKCEKLLPQDRRLECCSRVICGDCLQKNTRFETYCPYCQTSTTPSPLPQGLKEPPSYTSIPPNPSATLLPTADAPPPYTPSVPSSPNLSGKSQSSQSQPLLHFLNHAQDTIPSLSLAYSVPAPQLRSLNRLTSDHLLAARRTILIPSSASTPPTSLSPVPVEGEEEEIRKNKIRRWMVATKVADYDVAVLYLEQSGYNLAQAVAGFLEDEAWEREHPLEARKKGKGVLRIAGGGMGGAWGSQGAWLRRS
ncbi:hypothetical protein CONLIGDRAFT_628391 [Coniochaeta ligniaria NRRL 30616]|uniref:LysM domain-containing protein n=1 Tax=Coniochaeta ligniaria NRRL 30616 TaxID=1408157 RepID=A0A1J7J1Y0_9PEZI|nr:hypothetical protein CONLIGDRAFT_628391 [Coniochaeta ligniaria NRRL 30616]